MLATWSSSRATNGTRSGMRETSPAESSRSSRPQASRNYFSELVDALGQGPPDLAVVAELAQRYGLESDPAIIPGLCEKYGLTFGPA